MAYRCHMVFYVSGYHLKLLGKLNFSTKNVYKKKEGGRSIYAKLPQNCSKTSDPVWYENVEPTEFGKTQV